MPVGKQIRTDYGPDGTAIMGSDTETVAYVEPYRRDAHGDFLDNALSYWRGNVRRSCRRLQTNAVGVDFRSVVLTR